VNLAAIVAAVSDRTGIPSTDPKYASIDDRVNEALHAIETYMGGEWDWLYDEMETTTTASAETITFAALASAAGVDGVRRIRYVEVAYGDSWAPMGRESLRTLRSHYQGATTGTDLRHWTADGQKLYLFPTPSATISIRVGLLVTEPDLSSDSDAPLLPAQYHRVLVAAASGLVLRSSQRFAGAQVEESAAEQGLKQMLAAQRPYAGPGRVERGIR